jgi:two-component system, NarL family, sensor histidine kinase UhpB
VSLFRRVFLANTLVLFIALLLLTFSPITVDYPIHFGQFTALFVGFVVLVVMNFVLMRRLIAPLERLTDVMSTIDPDAPGTRLTPDDPRSPEGKALSDAFNGMLDRLETARREAARSALEAQEAELHDEVGQTLTAVTIQAERAAEGDPSDAPRALREVADSVRDSLDEVRRIARELRPEALDDLGLVNALIALSNRLDSQDGTRIERELQGTMPPLPPEVELVLYRIAQESLTNALRHANAKTITLRLHADGDSIALRVRDDGDGMPRGLPSGASGITGMRERALLVGGRLAIESIPTRGTEVRLRVPLSRNGR